MSDVNVRAGTPEDGGQIAAIYNHYVQHTTITFEEAPVSESEMTARMIEHTEAGLPFLVAEIGGGVAGYAYASKWKGRCAYRFSVEVSVYLSPAAVGKGMGSALYQMLFPSLRERGIHAVIGGIALPNEASVRLHEKFGMKQVAQFPEVGFKFGKWVDVGYWQRIFEP